MTRQGKLLSVKQGLEALLKYRVIFIGEVHQLRAAHEAELAILSGLWELDSNLALGLEIFERDVQYILDAYLKGEICEKTFLTRSRPWPNYGADYRPLIEWAKEKRIPAIAANVPRRAAAAVAMTDEISPEVLGADRIYLPGTLYLDSEEYRERFVSTMEGMPQGTPMGGKKVDGLFKAQVLKDAVMAASVVPYLDRRVLFCCGHFHCDYHLGIPYQLRKNQPDLEMAVITMGVALEDVPMQERSRIGDFIWIDE